MRALSQAGGLGSEPTPSSLSCQLASVPDQGEWGTGWGLAPARERAGHPCPGAGWRELDALGTPRHSQVAGAEPLPGRNLTPSSGIIAMKGENAALQSGCLGVHMAQPVPRQQTP